MSFYRLLKDSETQLGEIHGLISLVENPWLQYTYFKKKKSSMTLSGQPCQSIWWIILDYVCFIREEFMITFKY